MNFLDKIDAFCREHHISASRFEREAGLAKGLISNWRRYKGRYPSYASQMNVAAYMNISVADLMREIPEDAVVVHQDEPDIVRESAVRYIPVLAGLPGDDPIEPDMILKHIPALPETLESADNCFAMKVPDSSMVPEYYAGDIIIVLRCPEPDSGDIVVASVPGDDPVIIRKLIRKKDGIILQPFSRHFDAVSFRSDEIDMYPVEFSGKVIGLFRDIKSSSESVTE